MNQFINSILEMKENNILTKIPLDPAEIEELKQHIYEDLQKQFEDLKEGNIPICHVLSKLYKEEPFFKVLIDNYAQIHPECPNS